MIWDFELTIRFLDFENKLNQSTFQWTNVSDSVAYKFLGKFQLLLLLFRTRDVVWLHSEIKKKYTTA